MTGRTAAADADELHAQLASLRAGGAWRVDPIGFQALEKLWARIAGQPEPVQRLLQARLAGSLQDFALRWQDSTSSARSVPVARPGAGRGALVAVAQAARSTPELASVRRFRQAWGRHQAVDRVAQALARKPRNAGPLNSHALVLQTFTLLQAASPDYLRRVVGVVETLHWLERAGEAPSPRKATKRRG